MYARRSLGLPGTVSCLPLGEQTEPCFLRRLKRHLSLIRQHTNL